MSSWMFENMRQKGQEYLHRNLAKGRAQLFEHRLGLTRGEILTQVSFSFLSKALSPIIFSILFRVSNHQIVGKEN